MPILIPNLGPDRDLDKFAAFHSKFRFGKIEGVVVMLVGEPRSARPKGCSRFVVRGQVEDF